MSNDTDYEDLRPLPPAFYRLRLWWHELTLNDDKAATLRWQMNNATDPQECYCGARGTIAIEMDGFHGDVAPIHWSCDEHADVPLTVPWMGGEPQWRQSPEECSWFGKSIHSDVIKECGCGQHVGLPESEWRPFGIEWEDHPHVPGASHPPLDA